MYLIVGLGNPEPEYSYTRHNMGFCVINKIAENYKIDVNKKTNNALYGIGNIEGEKVILVKPQTYMNLSGEAILPLLKYYKLSIENLIVIYDDIDLDVGKIRILKQGGPGTHNGMRSVVGILNTKEFKRIRVGIGKPEVKELLMGHVIGKLTKEEFKPLEEGITKAAESITEIIKLGIDKAMNQFN